MIEKNAKMSKPRCRTCSGREGCFHLVIFHKAKEEKKTMESYESARLGEKENLARKTSCKTDLIDDDANLDEMPAEKKNKTENKLNPRNFDGAEANVFKQTFEYPPSKEDKLKNNKINKEESLFPNRMMIPPGKGIEKCSCGNDRLVRTSPAPSKSRSSVHFVSVDLLNEYMTSLFGKSQEGKSIDAFVNNKNILNCDERGEAGEISKKVFLKAFEIYIHATHYNTEEAFGCNQCPGELEKGEQEDDFENKREVHICDGIDMGNMQYATKGMVEEDLFQVPKVPSGVHYLYLFTPALNYLLSTFLTILHQHF